MQTVRCRPTNVMQRIFNGELYAPAGFARLSWPLGVRTAVRRTIGGVRAGGTSSPRVSDMTANAYTNDAAVFFFSYACHLP